ncbi:MAG TPA: aminoglycoside phosphotransferase, partial [Luteimonas sp.]|nr:aminoglycoside phosphotransferase [Luteimonas sp.]
MNPIDDSTAREHERLAWTQQALDDADVQLIRASVDAGFRSYWRTVGHAPTTIV